MSDILSVVGLLLQLAGIAMALVGLDELSIELFPGRPLPHRGAWRRVQRLFRRNAVPRLLSGSAAGTVTSTGSVRAQVLKARPRDDAPLSEWNPYWESRIRNLQEQLEWVQKDLTGAVSDLRERLAEESRTRSEEDTRLDDRLRVIVGGEGGSGLVKTWWGLAVTALGTLFQGIGGIIA